MECNKKKIQLSSLIYHKLSNFASCPIVPSPRTGSPKVGSVLHKRRHTIIFKLYLTQVNMSVAQISLWMDKVKFPRQEKNERTTVAKLRLL